MDKKLAFIFPGQGAQYVGMGKDFFEHFPVARETFLEADKILGFELSKLIFEGPSEELTLTKNSQVAIYVMSIALWRVVKEQFPEIKPVVCAGLSLGEYSAMTACNRMDFADGVKLVQARGLYMHEASLFHPGTMAVVLGLDLEAVEDVIKGQKGVWVANLNCPGQIVISGTHEGVAQASEKLKEKGAKRVLPLDVSGAFHSGLMEEAKDKLEKQIASLNIKRNGTEFVMNVPGDYVDTPEEVRQNLIAQVVSPVCWEKGIRKMSAEGIEGFIEIGCGKTLTGMNRKIQVDGLLLNVEKVEDLGALEQALDLKVEMNA